MKFEIVHDGQVGTIKRTMWVFNFWGIKLLKSEDYYYETTNGELWWVSKSHDFFLMCWKHDLTKCQQLLLRFRS